MAIFSGSELGLSCTTILIPDPAIIAAFFNLIVVSLSTDYLSTLNNGTHFCIMAGSEQT